MKLVESKALAGHVEQVEKIDASAALNPSSTNVVDLTELLQRSLGKQAAPKSPRKIPPVAQKQAKHGGRKAA